MLEFLPTLANIAGTDKDSFLALIREQNKAKRWSVSPIKIEFRDGTISHNATQIKGIVEGIKVWAEDELQKASLQTLKD